jgi:hypothetical protein
MTVSVSSKVLAEFGVDRFAKRRALDALAAAGLAAVIHQRGRNPVVTLLLPVSNTLSAGEAAGAMPKDQAAFDSGLSS